MESGFFITSKIFGLALQVESWLILTLSIGFLSILYKRLIIASVTIGLSLVSLLLLSVLPLGDLLLKPLEYEYPPTEISGRIDGLVVLGGVEDPLASRYWNQPQLNQAAERLTAAAALAQQYPDARIVFSGGSGRLRDMGDGRTELPAVAVTTLTSLGVSSDRIVWEDQSRNTAENARFSIQLIQPTPEEKWLLVTSAFHMGRAVASFEVAGWDAISPYPVDYRTAKFSQSIGWALGGNLESLNLAIKERVGRLIYSWTGR